MKFRYLLITFCIVQLGLKAQVINNLVVFCNEGERFTLILNGLKENQIPETNVRVEGLDLKVYQVRIIFENPKLKEHETTLTFYRTGKECVFALNKHGKKHTLDYVSEKEIDGFLNPALPQTPAVISPSIEMATTPPQPISTENNVNNDIPNTTPPSFQTTLANIISQPTEADKLNTAVTLLENNTFSVSQIKQMLSVFSTEKTRLAFAKQVCAKTKDPSTYTAIVDAFLNQAVKQELQNFLKNKK
jgi:hypothetical protein